ncbi:stage II sporulation protein E [Streptomyces sp. BK340]|nr:stage II sporulation protein E [Streptomyces sp. BK340]
MEPGSTLVLFTDGLIETRGGDLDQRLTELTDLLTGTTHKLDQLCDTLISRLAPTPAEDDIAILAARICPPN